MHPAAELMEGKKPPQGPFWNDRKLSPSRESCFRDILDYNGRLPDGTTLKAVIPGR